MISGGYGHLSLTVFEIIDNYIPDAPYMGHMTARELSINIYLKLFQKKESDYNSRTIYLLLSDHNWNTL